MLNFMSIHGCTLFQQDSALCHKAKSVMNWFQPKDDRVLKRPGNLIDLNPIENLWTLIKKKVFTSKSASMDGLKRIIKEVWCKDIDQNVCKNFINSISIRIQKIIKSKGNHTKCWCNSCNLDYIGEA